MSKAFFKGLKKLGLSNDIVKDTVLVHEGVKPASRVALGGSRLESFKEFLGGYGLYIAESDYKIVGKKDKGKGSWDNKVLRIVGVDAKEGNQHCYIARSLEKADELKNVEFLDPDILGQLLNYPKCCRRFFRKYFAFANRKQGDFILCTLSETQEKYPFDFYNNYAAHYFGYSLLSHFPCSFNCEQSSDIAKSYYLALKKYSVKWADTFLYTQKSAIIYTEYSGIFLLKNFYMDGNILRYSNSSWLYSTITNKNLYLLNEADNILIDSKNRFSARKGDRVLKTFEGENVGLLVFG